MARADALPEIEDRLAKPETRYEVMDGKVIIMLPADSPHGERHAKISALVEAHAAGDMKVAADMLTRTSKRDDIAPDVSVFPRARHPRTGKRQLEQLAFEVVSTQTMSYAERKARKLADRGVRRVFAIDVGRSRAFEWSRAKGAWQLLDPAADIEDPTLAAPLPVSALVSAAKADDPIARALLRKRNPVIEDARASSHRRGVAKGKREGLAAGKREGKRAGLAAGKRAGLAAGKRAGNRAGLTEGKRAGLTEGKRAGLAEGKRAGLAEAVLGVLRARRISVHGKARARILTQTSVPRITGWLARAATCATIDELFDADA